MTTDAGQLGYKLAPLVMSLVFLLVVSRLSRSGINKTARNVGIIVFTFLMTACLLGFLRIEHPSFTLGFIAVVSAFFIGPDKGSKIVSGLENKKEPIGSGTKLTSLDKKNTLKQFFLQNKIILISFLAVFGVLFVWNYLDGLRKQELLCLKQLDYNGDYYYIWESGNKRRFKTHDEAMDYCLKTFFIR